MLEIVDKLSKFVRLIRYNWKLILYRDISRTEFFGDLYKTSSG